jgi:DNA-binding phage protein
MFLDWIIERTGSIANFSRLTGIKSQNVRAISNPTTTTFMKIVDAMRLNDKEIVELLNWFAEQANN